MSDSTKAVFLSYASQDAEAAKKICDALRAAGVEVWFDQSELRGGDAWDAMIRRQIKECALFVPIISANTQARGEGYFRLEWKLAVDRSHLMAEDTAFLFPIIIDDVPNSAARVPDKFREVQWTKLRLDATPTELATRVAKLLRNERPSGSRDEAGPSEVKGRPRKPGPTWVRTAWTIVGLAFAVLFLLKPMWRQPRDKGTPPTASAPDATAPAVTPSASQKLVAQARALLDDDPFMTRANVQLAEQLSLDAIAKDQGNAEAYAAAAWANFRFIAENYEDTPQRRTALRTYADKARLLAPDSVNAELAMCALLRLNGGRAEAIKRLAALSARVPENFTVLREWAWAESWGVVADWTLASGTKEPDSLQKLRAFSPRGLAYADAIRASRLWVAGRYGEADRLLDGSFASGQPVRLTYLNRILILTYGWGDLPAARDFLATIPSQLLMEDVFITHETYLWYYLGEYDKALAALDRTQRDMLQEAPIHVPTAVMRGMVLGAAGRPGAAEIQWREALRLVDKLLVDDPGSSHLHRDKTYLLAALGDRAGAAKEFALMEEIDHIVPGSVDWAVNYEYFVQVGDFDAAFPRLERAMARDYGRWPNVYTHLRYDPSNAVLRKDPRMQPILERGARWLAELKAGTAAAVPAPASPPAVQADDKSVAVLAFANLSDDKANEYFSDGITEELLNVLAKVPGLKVTARTSSFYFKGRDVPIPEIAQKLGVAYVVEGSVRKAGDKVRITAQLIKAADGFHIWSDTFTRDLKDIFAVQDEIAGLIAKNLSLKLGERGAVSAAVDPRVFELYVQARQAWNLRSMTSFARAEQLLTEALQIDPDFVRGKALLVDVRQMREYRKSTIGGFSQRNSPLHAQILGQINEVLALEPNLAEAYATQGASLEGQWKFAESERAYRRAVALNPNYATGHQWLGMHLSIEGHMEEALAELKRATELDPLSPIILDNYGWLLRLAGRGDESLAAFERALALYPGFEQSISGKAAALYAVGRTAEAQALVRRTDYVQIDGHITACVSVGLVSEALALVSGGDPTARAYSVYPLIAAGRKEEALKAFSDFYDVSVSNSGDLLYMPLFDPIRNDPRFLAYLDKIGLSEAHTRAQAWRAAHQAPKPPTKP